MVMGVSTKGKKRDAYMKAWPQGKQNEALCDQLCAISDALRKAGVPLEDAPKFRQMLDDFATVKASSENSSD